MATRTVPSVSAPAAHTEPEKNKISVYEDLPSHLRSWPNPPPPTGIPGMSAPDEWLTRVGPLCGVKDKTALWEGIKTGSIPAVKAGKLGEVLPVPVSFSPRTSEEWLVPCDPAAFVREQQPLRAVVIGQNGQPYPTSITTAVFADSKTRDEAARQAIGIASVNPGGESRDLGKTVAIAWLNQDAVRVVELRQPTGDLADLKTADSRRIVTAIGKMRQISIDDLQRDCAQSIRANFLAAISDERPRAPHPTTKSMVEGSPIGSRPATASPAQIVPPSRQVVPAMESRPLSSIPSRSSTPAPSTQPTSLPPRPITTPQAPDSVKTSLPAAPTPSNKVATPPSSPVDATSEPVAPMTTPPVVSSNAIGDIDGFRGSQGLLSSAPPGPNSGHAILVFDSGVATTALQEAQASGQPLRAYAGIVPTATQFFPTGTLSKSTGLPLGHADAGTRALLAEKIGNDRLRILGVMNFAGVTKHGQNCQVQGDAASFAPLQQPIEVHAPGASKGGFMIAREYPEQIKKGVPSQDRERLWHEVTTAMGWV